LPGIETRLDVSSPWGSLKMPFCFSVEGLSALARWGWLHLQTVLAGSKTGGAEAYALLVKIKHT